MERERKIRYGVFLERAIISLFIINVLIVFAQNSLDHHNQKDDVDIAVQVHSPGPQDTLSSSQ